MLKQEKISELFKIIIYLIILFNLKKINENIKKLNLNYKFVSKNKKKEISIRRRVNRLVSTKFFRIFVFNKGYNSFKKIKKIIWRLKRSRLKSRFNIIKINRKFIKNVNVCYFNFVVKWSYLGVKKFDFIIKKNIKYKSKYKSKCLDCVIKKNNYFYLYYMYYNKKLIFIANLERFKKNKFFFHKKSRSYTNKILLFYSIFILKICSVKNINLIFFMKKRRRLNKKKYKIFTKTILDFKAFKHFFKLYKKLKLMNTDCNIKFKFIYNRSHSKRTEKLKKKRRK